jgi:hypothetical protein
MTGIDAGFWVDVAWKGATLLAVAFYVPVTRSLDRLTSRVDSSERDRSALEHRLAAMEGDMKALPTDNHIKELHDKVNKVAEDLAKLSGTSESNEVLLRAIHHKLMS